MYACKPKTGLVNTVRMIKATLPGGRAFSMPADWPCAFCGAPLRVFPKPTDDGGFEIICSECHRTNIRYGAA